MFYAIISKFKRIQMRKDSKQKTDTTLIQYAVIEYT